MPNHNIGEPAFAKAIIGIDRNAIVRVRNLELFWIFITDGVELPCTFWTYFNV